MAFLSRAPYIIGSILWLPRKNEIPLEYHQELNGIDDGCFNHPVLVLSANQSQTKFVILIITSFKGKALHERHPHDAYARSLHVPIYPSSAHPDNGSLLFLAGNGRLFRNSYVKIKSQHTLRAALLRLTRHPMCILRPDSFAELIKYTGFESPWGQDNFDDQLNDTTSLLRTPIVEPVPQPLPEPILQPLFKPTNQIPPEPLLQPLFQPMGQLLPASVRQPLFNPVNQPVPKPLRYAYDQNYASHQVSPDPVRSPLVTDFSRSSYRPGDRTLLVRQTHLPAELPTRADSSSLCENLAVFLVIAVFIAIILYYTNQ